MSQKRIPVHIQKQGADIVSGTDQQSLSFAGLITFDSLAFDQSYENKQPGRFKTR
ncbi:MULTISPECIES: hypothetical protein [Prochlorococcus]|uniref:hypothetical protein n=1 Tax=Prochlorococcus TaxID=1218 RepID=UPI001F2C193B|nr:hypothetical protein [Prochlorococcus marinus]